MAPGRASAVIGHARRPGRAGLRWLTVCGPASYLALLSVGVLYYHPHPLPPFWPAFVMLLTLSAVGTFVFSSFVFTHVRRQEEEIVHRTEQLADANEAMAVVKERQRLARELHDSVAQHLGYLHLRLADVERQLIAGSTPELEAEVTDLKRVAREAYEDARQAIFELRSMVSRSLRFVPTLTEYLHDWSRHRRPPAKPGRGVLHAPGDAAARPPRSRSHLSRGPGAGVSLRLDVLGRALSSAPSEPKRQGNEAFGGCRGASGVTTLGP